jgi:hypothetical protein
MATVAKADLSTGCNACTSLVLQSQSIRIAITAPSAPGDGQARKARCPIPGFCPDAAFDFVRKHGLAVRAVGAPRANYMHSNAHICDACIFVQVQWLMNADIMASPIEYACHF